jgi:hypothetical protein
MDVLGFAAITTRPMLHILGRRAQARRLSGQGGGYHIAAMSSACVQLGTVVPVMAHAWAARHTLAVRLSRWGPQRRPSGTVTCLPCCGRASRCTNLCHPVQALLVGGATHAARAALGRALLAATAARRARHTLGQPGAGRPLATAGRCGRVARAAQAHRLTWLARAGQSDADRSSSPPLSWRGKRGGGGDGVKTRPVRISKIFVLHGHSHDLPGLPSLSAPPSDECGVGPSPARQLSQQARESHVLEHVKSESALPSWRGRRILFS